MAASMGNFHEDQTGGSTHCQDFSSLSHLEEAIDSMAASQGGCFDPLHCHSFRGVSFLFPLHICEVCHQRLSPVSPFSSNQVVQCLACKLLAHRSCALSKDTQWSQPCPINHIKYHVSKSEAGTPTTHQKGVDDNAMDNGVMTQSLSYGPQHITPLNDELTRQGEIFRRSPSVSAAYMGLNEESTITSSMYEGAAIGRRREGTSYSRANFPFLSTSRLFDESVITESKKLEESSSDFPGIQRSLTWDGTVLPAETKTAAIEKPLRTTIGSLPTNNNASNADCTGLSESFRAIHQKNHDIRPAQNIATQQHSEEVVEANIEASCLKWTAQGPPSHWATGDSLAQMLPATTERKQEESTPEEEESNTREFGEEALRIASHPFVSVSRALHENILVHFQPVARHLLDAGREEGPKMSSLGASENDKSNHQVDVFGAASTVSDTTSTIKHDIPSDASADSSIVAEELLKEAEEAPNAYKRRLGLATVAGGIAGGVAGMAFAGPVGGVIGAKFGQTAGILGVVLEGSWTIGVITSGIVAGSNAGQHLQEKIDEKRVLALNGTGTSQGVLLVRPSVRADPAWAIFCEEAKRSHRLSRGFNFLSNDTKAAHRERYEREADIVNTDPTEIPTPDKILLLVSRILNDKESQPGYVYRHLIEKFKERTTNRGELATIVKESSLKTSEGSCRNDESECLLGDDQLLPENMIRARRQDAHSVIKFVTATLLELRPGFAASPSVTEHTATAVEALVFGEIYDLVMEEIEAEFESRENELFGKLAKFERIHSQHEDGVLKHKECTSDKALVALGWLPEAHSAVDKLGYCVTFLERISEFFSNKNDATNHHHGQKKPMGADSLLKLVCQHILAAKVFGINAQIAFLEEFARDEQLLRGKEGYALVTLQASLHFLNSSSDFDKDIFNQEDD